MNASSVSVSGAYPLVGCLSTASLLAAQQNANAGGTYQCARLAAGRPVYAAVDTRSTSIDHRRMQAAAVTVNSVAQLLGAVFTVVPTDADIAVLTTSDTVNVLPAMQAALDAASASSLTSFTTFYSTWTLTNAVAAFSASAAGLNGTALVVGVVNGAISSEPLNIGALVGGIVAGRGR